MGAETKIPRSLIPVFGMRAAVDEWRRGPSTAIRQSTNGPDGSSGTLRITTRAEDDAVVVEIADTGPGLSEEAAARAFDAFFTTKDVGKGTGLGLDIARRVVVERHEGTIELVREGDETVARIRLPR